jgi:hypothetical protein
MQLAACLATASQCYCNKDTRSEAEEEDAQECTEADNH